MNDDGSDKKQVSFMEVNCLNPQWSHNGSMIAFATSDDQVYLIDDISTGNYRFMWKGNSPMFTSTDEEIIFISDFEGVNSIYVIGLSDTEPMILSDGNYSNQATLSDDGNYLVYSKLTENGKCIMVADMNSESDDYLKKISVNKDSNLEPDISPDDRKYVYAGFDMNLNGTIYINENGSEKALTKDIPSSTQPKFSPDGSKIAFAVIKGERVKLYTMNSDGSNKQELTIKGGDLGLFDWLDNSRIIYDAESQSESYSIGVINVNTGEGNLIASGGFNLHPDVLNQ
jgi:Tol biopolymer transport system component